MWNYLTKTNKPCLSIKLFRVLLKDKILIGRTDMSPIILVTGATGFVGSHLVQALSAKGYQIRALVRDGAKTDSLRALGCDIALGDVTDISSLDKAMQGIDVVYHLVGIRRETRKQSFESVNSQGTKNVVDAMIKANLRRLIFVSIVKADPNSRSRYLRSKWFAEEAIRESSLSSTIFRSAVIYGEGGEAFTTLVNMVRTAPIVPVVGNGLYKMQPLFVGDLIECLVRTLDNEETLGRLYEIGGPEAMSFNEVLQAIGETYGKRTRLLHQPAFMVKPFLGILENLLPRPLLTREELELLFVDTICDVQEARRVFGQPSTTLKEGLLRAFPMQAE